MRVPASCTLHPTPHTLHPKPQTQTLKTKTRYLPMRVPAAFWPGQLSEAELVKVDHEAGPARDRAR